MHVGTRDLASDLYHAMIYHLKEDAMTQGNNGTWSEYQPTKKVWFWSTVGASLLTMILGFTFGGWMTAGGASVMADQAVRMARAELISNICVHNFVSAANAAENLKELKSKSSWERDDFITNGGWASVDGLVSPVPNAADVCAKALIDLKELPIFVEVPTSSSL
ncbi:hypothetical protein N183_32575 [Sinorhizobium sp. Sb3]|nr:hypothetical protein N183_32575 [Sinorhizobium sp. Sb3]